MHLVTIDDEFRLLIGDRHENLRDQELGNLIRR